jgi:hypothetical protein
MSNANHMSLGRLNGSQNISTSNSVANSSAFQTQTRKILVVATVATFIAIGAAGAASVANGQIIPANFPFVFTVNPGEVLSAILSTGTGSVSLSELSS